MSDRLDAALTELGAAIRAEVRAFATALPPSPGKAPGEVLDLRGWKLTLPTGDAEAPTEVLQPELATYTGEWFSVRPDGGVAFLALCGAVTTSGSHYPRSELREMTGKARASWSNTTGTHTLSIDQAITRTPVVKPHVVAGQIHDDADDVIQIRLEGRKLFVAYADGKKTVALDDGYVLGARHRIDITAAGGRVKVAYNGAQKADLALSGSGWYWKVGVYVQSNVSKGDAPDAAGEVVVYSAQVGHS